MVGRKVDVVWEGKRQGSVAFSSDWIREDRYEDERKENWR